MSAERYEFVPPLEWVCLTRFFLNRSRTWGAGLLWCWGHWAFGFEFYPEAGQLSALLGPLCLCVTQVRAVTSTNHEEPKP